MWKDCVKRRRACSRRRRRLTTNLKILGDELLVKVVLWCV